MKLNQDMIVLIHENHNKMAKCDNSPTLSKIYDHAKRASSVRDSKHLINKMR